MNSIQNRAKPLETIISICIIALLLTVAVFILIKQSDFDMSRYGIDINAQTQEKTSKIVLSKFIPPNFKEFSDPKTYTAENLYEKINGKAPLYTEAGFEKLYTQRFVSQTDDTLWAELYLYDMADPENAFAVFSQQKRPQAMPLDIVEPAFGYKTTNGIYMIRGNYYIEIIGSTSDQTLVDAILNIAKKIQSDLPAQQTMIPELEMFPKENLIQGSFTFYRTAAFGFEGLTDVFTARYEINNETITAFISKRNNPQDAQTLAKSYKDFLVTNGAKIIDAGNKTLSSSALDFYGTIEIVHTKDSFVLGIHTAEDKGLAETIAMKLLEEIK